MSTRTSKTLMISAIGAILLGTGVQAVAACPNVANMRLTAKENHLSLNDNMPVCVERNESGQIDATFRIKISNSSVSLAEGAVTVVQKGSPEPISITGANTEEDGTKIKIDVVGSAPENAEFAYKIYVDDIGMLDPKVRVVPSPELQSHQAEVLEETLDAYDLSPEEGAEILRTIKP